MNKYSDNSDDPVGAGGVITIGFLSLMLLLVVVATGMEIAMKSPRVRHLRTLLRGGEDTGHDFRAGLDASLLGERDPRAARGAKSAANDFVETFSALHATVVRYMINAGESIFLVFKPNPNPDPNPPFFLSSANPNPPFFLSSV